MVAQEHHGLLAQLVGDINHLLGQLRHLTPLEGHKVLELLGGDAVLVVVVPLVDDKFGAETVANLPLKLLQDIGGDGCGVPIPIHVLFPLQLVEDEGKLVEEGRVADHIHIGVLSNKFPQPLHSKSLRLGLSDIEGDLVLEVLPAVGDGIVHMDRVPDEVGQETDGVVVERLRRTDYHAAALPIVPPIVRGQGDAGSAVHDLPPAADVVPGVDLEQLVADPLHQGDGEGAAGGGVESGHDVALLHLFWIGLGPGVVLAGGVVGGVDLGVHPFELLRVIGAVAVADGIRAPALDQLQGFGHHVHICGDCYPAKMLFIHNFILFNAF